MIMRAMAAGVMIAALSSCGTRSTPSGSSHPSNAPAPAACQPAPQDAIEAIAHGARHGESTLRALAGGATVEQADGSVLVAMRFTLQEWPDGRAETGVWRIGPHTDQPNVYAVNESATQYSSWPPFPVAQGAVTQARACVK
jgi:hypothetical protein